MQNKKNCELKQKIPQAFWQWQWTKLFEFIHLIKFQMYMDYSTRINKSKKRKLFLQPLSKQSCFSFVFFCLQFVYSELNIKHIIQQQHICQKQYFLLEIFIIFHNSFSHLVMLFLLLLFCIRLRIFWFNRLLFFHHSKIKVLFLPLGIIISIIFSSDLWSSYIFWLLLCTLYLYFAYMLIALSKHTILIILWIKDENRNKLNWL